MRQTISNNLIAQHNELIESFADMSKTCLKLFELIVSQLDSTKEQRTVTIRKNIIFSTLGKNSHKKNSILRKTLKELQHNAIFHLKAANANSKEVIISPISKVEWREIDGYVKITFTPEILPYITLLKQNFTQYRLKNITKLNSMYSIVIYKILVENFNAYEYYLDKGNRSSNQLEEYSDPVISVNELRRITNAQKKYERFIMFRKNVLDKAIDEINEKTDIFASYEKIYTGHYITDIQFHLKRKSVDANEEDLRHVDTVIQTKRDRKASNNQLAINAVTNNYTKMLLKRNILSGDDLTNKEVLIGLEKNVYSKYDYIKKKLGLNGVKNHMDYVYDHMNDTIRHTNIAKYLNKAVSDYIYKMGWK